MAGRFPARRRRRGSSGATCATASSRSRFFTDEELQRGGRRSGACCAHPRYVTARRRARRRRAVRRRLLRLSARARREIIDPQQRLFLECAWEALEDAGYDADALPRRDRRLRRRRHEHLPAQQPAANPRSRRRRRRLPADASATTRTSWRRASPTSSTCAGPSVDGPDRLLDLARRRPSGLPEPAAAASATWRWPAASRSACPQQRGLLSTRRAGSSRPTATAGRSTPRRAARVGGSGVGVVVLKRLADALADGDTIHAVIRGSAINNDGVAQGRLHRAERRGPGAGRSPTAQAVAGVDAEHDRLRRGARHRHAARRSDRDRGADAGVPRRARDERRFCAHRLGQDATSATSTPRPASPA